MNPLAATPAAPAADTSHPSLYGSVASFETPAALLAATRAAHAAGYRHMDAYTPVPVDGLAQALGRRKTRMPLVFLLGGIAGGTGGYFMQWFSMAVDYPYNIGGRPFHSWPMFIPVTFELTVLLSAISGVLGMLYFNGLPRLHHPIFKAANIERATVDRFVLCIESADPKWDRAGTRLFLENEAHARDVSEVEQ